jgi:hypothetical protein
MINYLETSIHRSFVKYVESNRYLAKQAGSVLYLDAHQANGVGLPINSQLTTPWSDLSGNANNATPTNMAGTTASGVDVSDPLRPFWALDGAEDFFSLVNTASVDITSAPLAVFATIKIFLNGNFYMIICKNTDSLLTTQYALYFANNAFYAYLEGAFKGNSATIADITDRWANVGFIWNGTNVKYYVDLLSSGNTTAFSGTLTSRPNLRIGRRETASNQFKGNIASVSIYAGTNATEANVLRAEKAISKTYIG